ncbi:hypothetical protein [Hymenobacter yonginensis]|uniref:DUF4258 domain-containing protein n=1 Tax=Hymenobacter yonginensis TaxID=748197 RepID=A0ABY7PNS0_9BACT|nr:hypothetical protein [Hymenobacter yonginensis]WBO84906.1 hypothetical protein O9Z63_01375 [Hymenobacter yonginensis]
MQRWLRLLALCLLGVLGCVALFYLYKEWRRVEKPVVVVLRSSNEDCDEFRCIWKVERVLKGQLTAAEAAASCYLINSKREYGHRDSVELIEVEGLFTNENGQAFYADCIGTLVFQDKAVKSIP